MKKARELKSVDPKTNFPKLEEEVLAFWEKNEIFEKSLAKNQGKKKYVFLEGPPTANGKPGIHHVLSRAYKDLYLRYKTMQGYLVERRAGWDTHGLPVELQVEKALGISGKPQIETLKKTQEASIAYFNQKCQESVWEYKKDWEEFTKRVGFWLDTKHPYVTYENTYIETLWWIIQQIWNKGLFYQDYKVVLHCPRCGSTLSSHEVAQGYKEIVEPSVYIKFALKNQKDTFILAWTTTPWTLPGNVALAIDPDIDYVKIKLGKGEKLILAQARLKIIQEKYQVLETFKGKKLLNLEYEPLFKIPYATKVHFVCPADFVTVEDGTGVVHTAVMYGEEDYELGEKIGLPKKHTVDEEGRFTKEVGKWAGKFVHDTNAEIIQDLKDRNLLYKTENTRHTYPFCWRCDTKLIYYAKTTWYIAVSKIQKQLLTENQKINWIPKHLKEGRFGEWLDEVKDWAFARERYWGTPLPIWQCENSKCKNFLCLGSVQELSKYSVKKPIQLIVARHGHAEHNNEQIYSDKVIVKYNLTPEGTRQIQDLATDLKKQNLKIDQIFSSDLLRCKTSAEILARAFQTKIICDTRLREINFGKLYGKKVQEAGFIRKNHYADPFPEGEAIVDVEKRVQKLLDEIQTKCAGKTILILTHENTIHALLTACMQLDKNFTGETEIPVGSARTFFLPEIKNLHRPEIDKVILKCPKCKAKMQRIEEVADVWFDSGSAPFGQWHYPFENQEKIDKGIDYPADYISEAIDQTRGWFYTLLAVATLLGKERPYKNVICLGLIRDKEGKKMSKSRGNIVYPADIAQKYGIDALRWYFYSVNQPGEYKNFDELKLKQTLKKYFLILWNIYSFLVTYTKAKNFQLEYQSEPKLINDLAVDQQTKKEWLAFDNWAYSKFSSLIQNVNQKLDNYDVTNAIREIGDFINLFSTWYLRRSRKRFAESKQSINYLYSILIDLCKLIAPFSPFIVEEIYQNLRAKTMPESIHLCDFPKPNSKLINKKVEKEIDYIREITSLALNLRAKAGIKVRQPLDVLYIKTPMDWPLEYVWIIQDEANVKEVKYNSSVPLKDKIINIKGTNLKDTEVFLDTEITPELKEEGIVSEIIRNIQTLRKDADCNPQDKVFLGFSMPGKIHFDSKLEKKIQGETYKTLSNIENQEIILELIK